MNENYYETALGLNLNKEELKQLAINAFKASWLSDEEKALHISRVAEYFNASPN
jgi:adenosine deaminase